MYVDIPWVPGADMLDEAIARVAARTDSDYTNNSFGISNFAAFDPMLTDLMPQFEEAAMAKLAPNCTFLSVYRRGATLRAHTDREGLDWTVSVMLRADAPWSLEAIAENGDWESFPTDVNSALLLNGSKVRHGRFNPYRGDECAALLLHYHEVTGDAFHLVKGVLAPEDIARIESEADTSNMIAGKVGEGEGAVLVESRRSRVAWLDKKGSFKWLYDRMRAAADAANSWGVDISGETIDNIQLAHYGQAEKYDWHQDRHGKRDGRNARSLSCVVLLEPPELGGGFEMKRGGYIKMEPGDMVVFPSTEWHRALPVVAGTRKTLTHWFAETKHGG